MHKDKAQALYVYSVALDEHERDGTDWIKIGLAFPHMDGKGFDVTLEALPLYARLVLREPAAAERRDGELPSLARQVEAFERALIEQCLVETGGKISAVIDRLGIPRRTLNEKMTRLGISRRKLANNVRPNNAGRSLKSGNSPPTT